MDKPEPPKPPKWDAVFPELTLSDEGDNNEDFDQHHEAVGAYEDSVLAHVRAVSAYLDLLVDYESQLTRWRARNGGGGDQAGAGSIGQEAGNQRPVGPHDGNGDQPQQVRARGPVTEEDVQRFFSKFFKPQPANGANPPPGKRPRLDPASSPTLVQMVKVAFAFSASANQASIRIEVENEEVQEMLRGLDVERAHVEIDRARNVIEIHAETETLPHPEPLEFPIPPEVALEMDPILMLLDRVELVREGDSALIITLTKAAVLPGGPAGCPLQ